MRRITQATLLTAAAALAACSGGGDENSSANGSAIRSFSITGTNGVTSGSGEVRIGPSQNGGVFRLDWNAASSTRPYRADFYVSPDAALSAGDQQVFGRNCDQPAGDCQNQSATFFCTFDGDVKLTCPSGSGQTTQMSTWFASNGGLPGSYNIILRVCDGLFNDCVTRALPVVFE